MIVKCAEASVLRKAFPSQLAGLYIQQEAALITSNGGSSEHAPAVTPKTVSDLVQRERAKAVEQSQQGEPAEATPTDPLAEYRDKLSFATTEQEARDVYERCGNPNVSNWTPDQDKQAVAEMHERIAAVKGGAK